MGNNSHERIYLDYAATTPVDAAVAEAMLPFLRDSFGNPSTVYYFGQQVRAAVEGARERVAETIGARPEEIVFVSGGTEANNLAITGTLLAKEEQGRQVITTSIEHHSVLETCHYAEKRGYDVVYLPVDSDGLVDPAVVEEAITDKTVLVSIMHANNEIGTIEPIAQIGELVRARGVPFHTDAVQTVGAVPVNVDDLKVDLLSLSGHKIYGPKGIGALYVRKGTRLTPLLHGGHQERKRRAGTENVPGIIGLAKACELVQADSGRTVARVQALRDRLVKGVLEKIERVKLNGHPDRRLPNNANLGIEFVEGESILLNLDFLGIAAASGSACTSDTLEPSHVLLALGIPHEIAHGSLRFSLGKGTTEEEVDRVIDVLPSVVAKLRALSPYEEKWSTGSEDYGVTTESKRKKPQ